MGIKLSNNTYGTLAGAIASGVTAIALTAGHGARFPTLGATDYFFATLVDAAGNLEIIKVTARAGDNLTAVRQVDGTTARAFSGGDRLEIRPCNAAMLALQTERAALAASGTNAYTATLPVAGNGYNSDQIYFVRFTNAPTITNPTLDLGSGAAPVVRVGGGAISLTDIPAGHVGFMRWDGANFVLLNPQWIAAAPADFTMPSLLFT